MIKNIYIDMAENDLEYLETVLKTGNTFYNQVAVQCQQIAEKFLKGYLDNLHVEIGDFLRFADYFFDSLFTDWMVYDKINDSRNRTLHTCDQIQKILGQLNEMDNELCSKKENLQKELEQTVLNS